MHSLGDVEQYGNKVTPENSVANKIALGFVPGAFWVAGLFLS